MKKAFFVFLILFFISNSLKGQENKDDFRELKLQIQQLQKEKNVLEINKLINVNNYLQPSYAFNILNENLKIAKQNESHDEIADTYLALGNFWTWQGNKPRAYENYIESESISKRNKNYRTAGLALMNRAILTENDAARIEMYEDAIEALTQTDDLQNLAKAYLNLGNAYSVQIIENTEMKNSHEVNIYKKIAFENYNKADSLNRELKSDLLLSGIKTYKAEWFKFEGNFPKAKQLFSEAEMLNIKSGFTRGQVKCIIDLAGIAMEEKDFDQSLSLLSKAKNLSENYKLNDYLMAIYNFYVQIYRQLGDLNKALEYHQFFTSKALEMKDQNSQDKIHLLNLEHEIRETEFQIEKYESQTKINRILIITSLLTSLLIALISYFIIQNKKRKIDSIEKTKQITELEKSAIEIKLKNQLLEDELLKEKVIFSQNHLINFANLSNRINFFLDELKSKVKRLPNGQETQEDINSLKMKFSEILNNQNQFTQINSMSTQLNQDFFFYIRQHFPNISKEDQQLLGFIILNFSSKEISSNLNISTESVYKKRYRLRKKLNLENEETFEDFYQKIISSLN